MRGITIRVLKFWLVTFCVIFFAACICVIFLYSQSHECQRADIAAPRINNDGTVFDEFLASHFLFVDQASKTDCQVLFLGDSITSNWANHPSIFNSAFEKYRTLIFGFPGDCTQHVLWRIENGELGSASPAVIVLLIGTNNTIVSENSADSIAAGIRNILSAIHGRSPHSKVVLLGLLPRGFGLFEGSKQKKIIVINLLLAKLHNGCSVFFLDVEGLFLLPNGSINKGLLPDLLHPSEQGYEILALLIKQQLKLLIP